MGYGQPDQADREMMALALAQARISLESGGVPVGAVLAAGGQVIAAGHNERVQRGDPVAHGEIACLRNAGRRRSYAGTTMYTTLSPCPMCTGATLLFQIPRVVVGEAETFAGDLRFLADRGCRSCSWKTRTARPRCGSSSGVTPRSGARTSAAADSGPRGPGRRVLAKP
jgi:cytosine/creatinine deaminase